ncbi:MAG: hypothetical protein ABW003_05305 [Microvirga sp.]
MTREEIESRLLKIGDELLILTRLGTAGSFADRDRLVAQRQRLEREKLILEARAARLGPSAG